MRCTQIKIAGWVPGIGLGFVAGGVPGEELEAECFNISYIPSFLKLQHDLILTIYQAVRRLIPAFGWAINLTPVEP